MQRPCSGQRWRTRFGAIALVMVVAAATLGGVAAAEDEVPTGEETAPVSCAATGAETIATDREQYQPGDTVLMDGTGYAGDCDVVVRVTRPDGSVVIGDGSFTPGSDTVSIPADGNLAYQYVLNGITGTYLVDVLGAGDAVLASTTFEDPAVQLFSDSTFLTRREIFQRGDTVYAKFDISLSGFSVYEVFDPSGVLVQATGCVDNTTYPGTRPENTYLLASDDPLSSGASWVYRLTRYSTSTCAAPVSVFSTPFYVAEAFAFATQAQRDACTAEPCAGVKSAFGTGQTAWVKVLGFKPGITDITSTQWQKPNSVLSPLSNVCRNSADADRPDSDASGSVATGYRPADVGEVPNTSPASVAACGAFGASGTGEEGQWHVFFNHAAATGTLIVLPTFLLDITPPVVTINSITPSPVDPGDSDTDVNWEATEDGTYSVRVGGTSCTTGTEVESGSYTAPTAIDTNILATELAYGSNTIRVCVTDGAGNTGSDTETVVRRVPTVLTYSGDAQVILPATTTLKGTLTDAQAACNVAGQSIVFKIDLNGDGDFDDTGESPGSAATTGTNNSAQAVLAAMALPAGVYVVRIEFSGSTNCAPSTDEAVVAVVSPDDAANGGGWYQIGGVTGASKQVNYGFTTRWDPRSSSYRGQILVHNKAAWRLKGEITGFAKKNTSPVSGEVAGTGVLSCWDTALETFVVADTSVSFKAVFTDTGNPSKKSGGVKPDSFTVSAITSYSPGSSGCPATVSPLVKTALQPLKGGNNTIK